MRFRIEGKHRSGVVLDPFVVDADSQEAALVEAKSRGVIVGSIKPFHAPPEVSFNPEKQASAVVRKELPTVSRIVSQFVYKMVQIPPTIVVETDKGSKAAVYLESVVNRMASEGWDFYRVDAIGVRTQPGCLGALMGISASEVSYYVITFRQPKT